MPGVYGVHDASHHDVQEWTQHLQELQAETEGVPDLQTTLPERTKQSP